jgi:hypothetical protein
MVDTILDAPVEKTDSFEDIPLYKMSIPTFLDGIGFYGPIIILFIIIYTIYKESYTL